MRSHSPLPTTDIHPETAARYGILEGDEVTIKTKTGEIRQYAHLTDKIHPRVIYCAFGWWFPEAGPETQYDWERSNFNVLTSVEKLGREFGTPNVKGIGCIIKKI